MNVPGIPLNNAAIGLSTGADADVPRNKRKRSIPIRSIAPTEVKDRQKVEDGDQGRDGIDSSLPKRKCQFHTSIASTSTIPESPEPMVTGGGSSLAKEAGAVFIHSSPVQDKGRTEQSTSTRSASEMSDQEKVISVFSKKDQETIKANLETKEVQELLSSALKLLEILKKKRINLTLNKDKTSNLFSPPRMHIFKDFQNISTYFEKACTFFLAADESVKCTNSFTALFRAKKQVIDFTKVDENSVQFIAGHSYVLQLSSMSYRCGFPEVDSVKCLLQLPCLREGWQGDDKAVEDKPLDRKLLRSISSIHHTKGIPEKKALESVLRLPCLREGWQGNDKAVESQPIDKEIFSRITSMRSGKGFPEKEALGSFLRLPCLREGWQGNDNAVEGKPIDRELLSRISSMSFSKGFPEKEALGSFLRLPCLRMGWQGDDKAVEGKPIDRELLSRISSMRSGRGFPEEKVLKDFLLRPCLREGWQGDDKAVEGKPIDRELLSRISSMQNCKGFPEEKVLEDFLLRPCLRVGWQGDDKAVEGKPIDRELLSRISSMQNCRGIPEEKVLEDFLLLPCLRMEWQGDDKYLDRNRLALFGSQFHARGLPSAKQVSAIDGPTPSSGHSQ